MKALTEKVKIPKNAKDATKQAEAIEKAAKPA